MMAAGHVTLLRSFELTFCSAQSRLRAVSCLLLNPKKVGVIDEGCERLRGDSKQETACSVAQSGAALM